MKKVIQIVLALAIVALAYIMYEQLMTPLRFTKEVEVRERPIVQKLKDIRAAEQAYRQKYSSYTGDFDSLINYILYDSMTFAKSMGSLDDSAAVAQGLVTTELFRVPVKDTIFGRKVTVDYIKELPIIPHSNNERFFLNAGFVVTESGITVPVFECKAYFAQYLNDLNRQELINLIDERVRTFGKFGGLKVGDMESATNDAGNWE